MLFIAFILSFFTGLFSTDAPVAAVNAIDKGKTATVSSEIKLIWTPGQKLTWEDFKGNPDNKDPHHALTTANLALEAKCKNNKFVYEVKSVFMADQSWTKNNTSAQLLHHEQMHFDLTEVHARMLRQKLQAIGTSCETVQQTLDATVQAAFAAWKAEQIEFDHLSHHGLDASVQQAWAANIEKRLQELEAYQ